MNAEARSKSASALPRARSISGVRVLVTGATGFLGSPLLERLKTGNEVHAISRRPPDAGPGIRWWQADLADPARVQPLFREIRPEIVFHLAGDGIGRRDRELVLPLLHGHVVGTANVLDAALETGVRRVVMTASMEEPEPLANWACPSSPYAAAKWASSGYARMFHALYGAPIVLLRLFMVYGPARQDVRKLIPYVTLSLLRGEMPELSSGSRQIDWVYLDDALDALVAAANATSEAEGVTMDIGSGRLVAIRDVVSEVARIIGRGAPSPRFGALPDRAMEQVRAADPREAHTRLGWKPLTSLEEGLRRTVEWYRSRPEAQSGRARGAAPREFTPTRQSLKDTARK